MSTNHLSKASQSSSAVERKTPFNPNQKSIPIPQPQPTSHHNLRHISASALPSRHPTLEEKLKHCAEKKPGWEAMIDSLYQQLEQRASDKNNPALDLQSQYHLSQLFSHLFPKEQVKRNNWPHLIGLFIDRLCKPHKEEAFNLLAESSPELFIQTGLQFHSYYNSLIGLKTLWTTELLRTHLMNYILPVAEFATKNIKRFSQSPQILPLILLVLEAEKSKKESNPSTIALWEETVILRLDTFSKEDLAFLAKGFANIDAGSKELFEAIRKTACKLPLDPQTASKLLFSFAIRYPTADLDFLLQQIENSATLFNSIELRSLYQALLRIEIERQTSLKDTYPKLFQQIEKYKKEDWEKNLPQSSPMHLNIANIVQKVYPQAKNELFVLGYNLDIVLDADWQLAIEIDGHYHDVSASGKAQMRAQILEAHGWKIVRLHHHDWYDRCKTQEAKEALVQETINKLLN